MNCTAYQHLSTDLQNIHDAKVYKSERIITSKQGRELKLQKGPKLINFCANNYLGFGGSSFMIEKTKEGLDKYGFGMNSVRFICGTQDIHRELEGNVAKFLHCEDTILYSSCFDANAGLFETLLQKEDVIISDQLNHASIIDGVRLCKAERKRYQNGNMQDLEKQLKASNHSRIRLIATDGVFSMDGTLAPLAKIVELAEKYDALVMVDESHATGVIGETGRGCLEVENVLGKVDIVTGTFGKALGGASGGFTASNQIIVDLLRQKSRPYLFSNTMCPAIVYAENEVLKKIQKDHSQIKQLQVNAERLRTGLIDKGFDVGTSRHPIVPVMLFDEKKTMLMADALLQEGIYVIGFCYPVVPKGQARIRLQVNAIHSDTDIDTCIEAISKINQKYN